MERYVCDAIGRVDLGVRGSEPVFKKRPTGLRFYSIGLWSSGFGCGAVAAACTRDNLATNVRRCAARAGDTMFDSCVGNRFGFPDSSGFQPGGGDGSRSYCHRTVRATAGAATGVPAFAGTARIICCLFAVILVMLVFSMKAPAESLPSSIQSILSQAPVRLEDASNWTLEELFRWLRELVNCDLQKPIQFAIRAVGYVMFSTVLALLTGAKSWQRCVDAIAVLGFGVMSLESMMDLTDTAVKTAQDCQNYLAAFVPVFSGVAAAGGQAAGALVYSGMFLAISVFLAFVITHFLLPAMQIYFCFSSCACIWENAGIEEAAALFCKLLQWLLKICGIVFGLVLGVQNVLAGTVDSAALRTGKSALQGFIPVVGDAAAAALSGAAAAVQLLKGSLALAALMALTTVFVPVFLQCALYTAAFGGVGVAAAAGGQKKCAQLCRLFFEGSKLCASILILQFFMVFLSTALLLIAGNGG